MSTLFPFLLADTDERTEKIWGDVNQLLDDYGFGLDIVYSDPDFDGDINGVTIKSFSGMRQ